MSRRAISALTPPALAASAVAFTFAIACAKDQEAEYPQGQVQYQGSYGSGAQAGMASAGQGQTAPVGYGQGGAPTSFPPAAGAGTLPAGGAATGAAGAATGAGKGSAIPIDPAAAAVVQPVMNQLATTHTVAGAKPVGSLLAGNFATGQTLEAQLQLQPGKCYTVVATSLPIVSDLNVRFVAVSPIPGFTQVLATDSDTGPTAVLGKKPNCFKWPLPVAAPVKVVLEVAGGSGMAAAQVYEK